MKEIQGDLIQLVIDGNFDVIVHGCNCFCTMGSGIALQIKNLLPEAFKADEYTIRGDVFKLGGFTNSYVKRNDNIFTVINAYTQFHYGNQKDVEYSAISQVFKRIDEQYHNQRIAYPLIGAGKGGGNWEIISDIISFRLAGADHTLVRYKR